MSKTTEKHDKNSELGTLIVVLLKARNLNDKHSFRKQDVFAQATLNNVQKRSPVDIRGGQHPEWDSEVRFTVLKDNGPGGKNRKLEVACYSQEPKTEDLLGKATVDISDTLRTGEFDDWVSLDVDGVVRGDIYLEMTYYANAPLATAPKNKFTTSVQGISLSRRPSKLSPSDRLSRPIQKNATGPLRFSPKQPSRLHDQFNSTNTPPSARTNNSLLDLPAIEPVHTSATLPNTRSQKSLSLPQAVQPDLPSILRPGLGGRPSPSPSPPDVSLSSSNPYIRGSSPYTAVHSGLPNIEDTSLSNPYTTRRGNETHIAEQQYQQASGGRTYSPAPPGAFIPGNQSAPDGRSSSDPSRAVSPNPYTGSGAILPGGQWQQASGGRTYSPAPSTAPMQISGPPHPSVPITVSPPSSYFGSGAVYLPENQLGSNVPSYSPTSAPSPVQASRSVSIDPSAPTNPYAGGRAAFIHGSQQAPDGWAYSPSPPVDNPQTLGYANHVISLPDNGPSLSYNSGTGSSVSSGPLAFPMPMMPTVVEPYGYHEPLPPTPLHYQPPPPRTSSVSNNRSSEEGFDPHHLARYQTPLPLPPGSPKKSPPPLPPLPPPPQIAIPGQISSSPPVVVTATPTPDTARIEALRKVERDAAWRKEQELKDLELAVQLDRELNP